VSIAGANPRSIACRWVLAALEIKPVCGREVVYALRAGTGFGIAERGGLTDAGEHFGSVAQRIGIGEFCRLR
jgi:hypothetical protein